MTEKIEPAPDEEIVVRYTNWRGETADRRIRPCGLTFGTTKWHPEPQWLLEAWDQDKGGVTRQFALKDMAWPPNPSPDVREARHDGRYPSVFYSPDRTQRVGVGHYDTGDGPEHVVRLSIMPRDNGPGSLWYEVPLDADEAEQLALHLIEKVVSARAALARMGGGDGG